MSEGTVPNAFFVFFCILVVLRRAFCAPPLPPPSWDQRRRTSLAFGEGGVCEMNVDLPSWLAAVKSLLGDRFLGAGRFVPCIFGDDRRVGLPV